MLPRSLTVLAALTASRQPMFQRAKHLVALSKSPGRLCCAVPPDQVLIQLTVDTTDDDLIRVREQSDKDVSVIFQLAAKHGTDQTGCEVTRLHVTFDFNDQLRRRIYRVERDVTLRLTDLAKLDAMLSDLLGVGNLKIEGVKFVTSKSAQHESEARSQAVANAKEKAKHVAELNGLKLGKARNIQILTEHQRPFVSSVVPVVGSAGARSPRRQAVSPASPSSSADPFSSDGSLPFRPVAFRAADEEIQEQRTGKPEQQPFALGTIELTASVSIVFEMAK